MAKATFDIKSTDKTYQGITKGYYNLVNCQNEINYKVYQCMLPTSIILINTDREHYVFAIYNKSRFHRNSSFIWPHQCNYCNIIKISLCKLQIRWLTLTYPYSAISENFQRFDWQQHNHTMCVVFVLSVQHFPHDCHGV